MKKRGVKILTALLVIVMIMSFTTAVLAADDEQEAKGNTGTKTTMLYVEYAPELLSDYLDAKQEHEAFHEGRKAINETFKADREGQLQSILDAFVAGEMSGDEAMNAIIEMRDNAKALKEEAAAIREAKQAENEPLKTQRDSLRDQIKAALQADEVDAELMHSLLEQSLELLKDHLAVDYKYAAQMDAARAKYFPQ